MAYKIEDRNGISWALSLDKYDPEYLATADIIEMSELTMLLEIAARVTTKYDNTGSEIVASIMARYLQKIDHRIDALVLY